MIIMGFFGYALFGDSDPIVQEALKAAFTLTVGFWLGSSSGSKDKDTG